MGAPYPFPDFARVIHDQNSLFPVAKTNALISPCVSLKVLVSEKLIAKHQPRALKDSELPIFFSYAVLINYSTIAIIS
jgi:hypothetical protein